LTAGFFFQIQQRLADSGENKSKSIVEQMTLSVADGLTVKTGVRR
jgi:hypothetical protein